MTNLYNSAAYKNKIINLLLRNKDFVKVVNPSPPDSDELDIADVLIGGEWIINGRKYTEQGHIFDYEFVDDTIDEKKTFVFVETDINSIRQKIFTDFNLYICIFTSKDLVRITSEAVPTSKQIKEMGYFAGTYANRVDVLCDIVDRTLNGSSKVCGLGTIEPSSRGFCLPYIPNNKYYGKRLTYHITNFNERDFDDCGN